MVLLALFGIALDLHFTSSAVADLLPPNTLRISEGFKNPLGFYDKEPSFSWRVSADSQVKSQSAYRIVVASDPALLPEKADLWDTGKTDSNQSVWVRYSGHSLDSRNLVYWQVKYWDEKDRQSSWSEQAQFELGLLNNSDWKGKWIQMQGPKAFPPPQVWLEDPQQRDREGINITINRAEYGIHTANGETVDISDSIRQMVHQDEYLLQVSDRLAKQSTFSAGEAKLLIDYDLNLKHVRKLLTQGTTFNLLSREEYVTLVPEYFRKQFELTGPIKKARLYITARGLYQVHINGERIGEDHMTPGWTTYNSWIESLTYDVTEQLRKGNNVIAAILSEGWYAGRIGSPGKYTETHPELLCQLEVTFSNGKKKVIVTDRNWKATNQGPIRVSSIFDGEVYDARKEMAGWKSTGFDDSQWSPVTASDLDPNVSIAPKQQPPVRVTEKINALHVTEPEPGKFVFDFGQNVVGKPSIKIPVKKGETIRIRFAEMLNPGGTLYTENYRSARSSDYYVAASDKSITWEPTFTFHGFRYVELSGFSTDVGPQSNWVTTHVLHTDFERTGRFTSSHEKLNRLQENIIWGQRGNFLDIPTDCPQRDERQGWTGDAQIFCPTSLFNYDTHAFWKSWLRSMRANQREDGIIPWIVPSSREFKKFGSAAWGDAAVVVPWEVYLRTGDVSVLEENYRMMRRWVAAYEPDAKNHIVNRDGFGDWLQPYSKGDLQKKRGVLVGETALELIATAYYGRGTEIMQQVASVLGRDEDANFYKEERSKIRDAFSREFFDQQGRLTTKFETQTGYLLALAFDLLKPSLKAGAIRNLLREVDEAHGHLRTGFVGTPLLAPVLDENGHSARAYSILFKESYPSWFFSINQGATTMWERWNSFSHADGFGDAKMNSFNHYAYGAIGQWMYERVAGLAPDSKHPGYKHFFIQPIPGGPLTKARAELETPYGKAVSGWQRVEDSIVIYATVPTNSTATLIVPQIKEGEPKLSLDGKPCSLDRHDNQHRYEIAPGKYEFILKTGSLPLE